MSDPNQELTALRERMDRVNDRLVDTMGEFFAIADAIGEVKDRHGLPHQDLAREAEMKTRVLLRNRGPLTAAHLSELFNHLLRLSVSRMDEGGKARLSVGRGDGSVDRVVVMAGLALGGGALVLGTDGPDGLTLGLLDGPRSVAVVDLSSVREDTSRATAVRIRGARMYDYQLLRAAGRAGTAVILERNPGATVGEWLHAAEYIAAEGNQAITLCEAGSLTFGGRARPLLDVSAVALARTSSVLPVLVWLAPGPAGDRQALAAAAVAAGACGIIAALGDGGEAELAGLRDALSACRWAGSPAS